MCDRVFEFDSIGASKLLVSLCPGILSRRRDVSCWLSILQFLSIVKDASRTKEAIQYAQNVLRPFKGISSRTDALLNVSSMCVVYLCILRVDLYSIE